MRFASLFTPVCLLNKSMQDTESIHSRQTSLHWFQDSQLICGVAFKKTFSYAGFEMQPKCYENPKIALLNVELELKAEKDNAEVRVKSVEV